MTIPAYMILLSHFLPAHFVFLRSVRRFLVTANVVPIIDSCHPDYGALRSSETSVLTRLTRRNIPEECIVQLIHKSLNILMDLIFLGN
jgi:hypothetical protein